MDKGKKRRTSSRRKRLDIESLSKVPKDSTVASTSSADKEPDKSGPSSSSRRKRLHIESLSKAPKDNTEKSGLSSPGDKNASPKSAPNDAADKSGTSPTRTGADKSGTSPTRPGASSPEPNCAICLGKLENKSFTDSCFHMFCFVCLVEWSKVKAECPLCKQSFKSIIHNLKSYKDYDQYNIPQPEDRLAQVHEFAAPGGLRFRYRTTVTDHRYAHLADRIDQEIQRQLLQRPSHRAPIPNWRRLRQPANSDFRRSVYTQRMQLGGRQSRSRRRVRDTSPSFFRGNPAQTHRLVPWLNRELNALLQGENGHVAFVLELIMGLITRYSIDSVEFREHVLPYVGRFTQHFQQEFLAFAKSPFHMAAYDRNVTYEPRENANVGSDSDRQEGAADDGNDSDIIVVSPSNSSQPDTAEPRRVADGDNTAEPRRAADGDDDLDPWERSIMTVGNPSYLGFAPIVRSFRQDDLSQPLDPASSIARRFGLNAPPGASDWDSPTHGASTLFGTVTGDSTGATATSSRPGTSRQHIVWSPMTGRQHVSWHPASASTSAPATPSPLTTADELAPTPAHASWESDTPWPRPMLPILPPIFEAGLPASMQSTSAFRPISVWPSTSQNDPIVCHESGPEQSSNESDLEIIDYEKPWTERSPIKLSSGEESDCDVMITGSSYANDPVKTEKKPRHRKRELLRMYGSSTETDEEKNKSDGSRSYSKTIYDPQPAVSQPRSPMNRHERDYQQSLLSVMMSAKDKDKQKRKRRHHEMSSGSSSSDSNSQSKHVSIHSRKHRSSSKHSHIEILEYKKKSKKHKKSSKSHRKDGRRGDSDEDDDDREKRRKDQYYNIDAEKYDSDQKRSKSKHSKHKKKKSKDKKHKHKDKSKERVDKPTLPNRTDEKSSTISDSTSDTDNFYEKFSVVMKEISKRKAHEISESASDVDIERKSDSMTCPENQKDVNKKRKKEIDTTCSDKQKDVNKKKKNEIGMTCSDKQKDVNKKRKNEIGMTCSDKQNDVNKKKKNEIGMTCSDKQKDVNKKRKKEFSKNKSTIEQSLIPEVVQNATEISASDHTNKSQENYSFQQPSVDTSQLEFVELSSTQASVFDQELDSVTKSLLDGHFESLFTNYGTSEPKHFKKHPHGHKKSSKKKAPSATFSADHNEETPIQNNLSVTDNTIQSNDISSCTDIDANTDYQLPPFLSFVDKQDMNKGGAITNTSVQNDVSAHVDSSANQAILLSPEIGLFPDVMHTSPTIGQNILEDASAIASLPSCDSRRPSSCINVDSISNDSDIDVIGEDNDNTFISVPCYKTSNDSVRLPSSSNGADAVNAEQNDLNLSPEPGLSEKDNGKHYFVDVLGVSESDSDDSHVQFIGEEQEKIEITGESDSEKDDDIDVVNDSDIDIIGHSEDDIVIDADVEERSHGSSTREKHNTSLLSAESETASTDLDYNCEEEESNDRNSCDNKRHKTLKNVASGDCGMAKNVDGGNKSSSQESVADKMAVDGNKHCDDADIRTNRETYSDTSTTNCTNMDTSLGKESEDNLDDSICSGEAAGDTLNDTTSDIANTSAEVDMSSELSHHSEESLHSEKCAQALVERSPNSSSPYVKSSQDDYVTDEEQAPLVTYKPPSPSTSHTDTSPSRAYGNVSTEPLESPSTSPSRAYGNISTESLESPSTSPSRGFGDISTESPESSPSALISPQYVATLYESSSSQGYPSFDYPTHSTYPSRNLLYQPSSPEDYYDSFAPED